MYVWFYFYHKNKQFEYYLLIISTDVGGFMNRSKSKILAKPIILGVLVGILCICALITLLV